MSRRPAPVTVRATVRRAIESDIHQMAEINFEEFHGHKSVVRAEEWVTCWYKAYPIYHYFVSLFKTEIISYVGWQIHGGFDRFHPAIELEQVAVKKEFQERGFYTWLLDRTRKEMIKWVIENNSRAEGKSTLFVCSKLVNFPALQAYLDFFTDNPGAGVRAIYGEDELILKREFPLVRRIQIKK